MNDYRTASAYGNKQKSISPSVTAGMNEVVPLGSTSVKLDDRIIDFRRKTP